MLTLTISKVVKDEAVAGGVSIVNRLHMSTDAIKGHLPPFRAERRPIGICVTKYP
jgi:hypothetical protein